MPNLVVPERRQIGLLTHFTNKVVTSFTKVHSYKGTYYVQIHIFRKIRSHIIQLHFNRQIFNTHTHPFLKEPPVSSIPHFPALSLTHTLFLFLLLPLTIRLSDVDANILLESSWIRITVGCGCQHPSPKFLHHKVAPGTLLPSIRQGAPLPSATSLWLTPTCALLRRLCSPPEPMLPRAPPFI